MPDQSPSSSSNQPFDPYHKWLGISPKEQPPHHYRLLGLNTLENDVDVIEAAANRQSAFLRQYATGPHGEYSQKLLNEVSAAQICLLVPEQKAEYDKKLREKIAAHKAKSKAKTAADQSKPEEKPKPTAIPTSIFKDDDDDEPGGTYAIEKKTAAKPKPAVKQADKKMAEADIQSFFRLSQQCIEKHDYAQAVELLQDIPRSQRSSNVQKLYERAVQLDRQSEELNVEMNDAFAMQDYETALRSAKRLLKLKPGHRRAKEIAREITQKGLLKNRARQQQRPRKKGLIPPVFIKLAVASVVIGGIVWGGMQLMNGSGKDGDGDNSEQEIAEFGTVKLRPDAAFRNANFTLFVDGKKVTLAELENGLKLKAGPHTLEVKDGKKVVHKEQFSVDPENEPVVSLALVDGKVSGVAVVELDEEELELPEGDIGEVRLFKGHGRDVAGIAFSPNGRYLASAGYDQTTRLWNVETGAEIRSFRPGNNVSSVAFSPDGKWIAMNGDRSNSFHVWDLKTGLAVKEFAGHQGPVSSIAYSPDGSSLVSASGYQPDGSVRLWDSVSGLEKWSYRVHRQSATSVSFSPDGKQVLAVVDGLVTTLDAATGERLRLFDGAGPARFSADGSIVMTKSGTQSPQLWNSQTGGELRSLTDMTYLATSAFSSTGPFAAFSTNNRRDYSISLWNTVKNEKIATFEGHEGTVYALAFSPDGRFLASGSRDKTVRLWRLPKAASDGSIKFESLATTPAPLAESPVGEVRTIHAAGSHSGVSADGHLVATSSGGYAKVWNIATGELTFKSLQHNATRTALSHDGRYVVSVDNANTLRVWEVASGRELQRIALPGTAVVGISYPTDNERLLATVRLDRNADSTVALLLDLVTGRELQRIPSTGSIGIRGATMTPDSKLIATVDWSRRSAHIFDATTGEEQQTVALQADDNAPPPTVSRMKFSPDGKRLVIAGSDRILRLIDVETGKQNGAMPLDAPATGLDLSPDGRFMLTSGTEVRLYNVAANRFDMLFEDNAKDIKTIRFVPGGKYAVTTSTDSALRVWRLPEITWPQADDASPGKELDFSVADDDIRRIEAHNREIRRIVFAPDGQTFATISSGDANIRLWSATSGSEQKTFKTDQYGVGGVTFVAGNSLISGQSAGQNGSSIIDWNLNSGNELRWSKGHGKSISDLVASPDGKFLLTASAQDSGSLRLWEIAGSTEKWRYELSQQTASSLAFTPDGTRVFAEIDGVVMLLAAADGKRLKVFDGTGPARLSPDGRLAVTSGPDALRLWDVESGKEIQRFRGLTQVPTGIAFAPDGRYLVTSHDDRLALKVWDVKSGKQLIQRRSGADGRLTTVAFAPNEDLVAYGTKKGIVGLWKLPAIENTEDAGDPVVAQPGSIAISNADDSKPGELGRIVLPGYQPSAPVISGDGKFVALTHNYVAKVWNLETGAFIFKSVGDRRVQLYGVTVAPEAAFVLTRTSAGIDHWDVTTGQRTVFAAIPNPQGFSLSPDGKRLVVFAGSKKKRGPKSVDVYDTASRAKLHTLSINSPGRYPRARFSPDSTTIAVVDGATVKLFDAETGDKGQELKGHKRDVYSGPVFSQDGQFVYTYGDRLVKTWTTANGKELRSKPVSLNSITLGPNGTFLSPSTSGIKVYRASSGEESVSIDTNLSRTTYIRYAPGGEFAVSTGDDNTLRTWRLPARRRGAAK